MIKPRVVVIGAGVAGLSAAKHSIANGMDVTVYEQGKTIGGTWVYTDYIGKNEYGLDVHSSMYKGLHTNLPKEIMGYPDFPIPDQEKSYIPAEDMLKFLNLYAEKFQVKEKIKYEHYVIRVRPKDNKWEVIVQDLPNNSLITEIFDFIFVCSGHYHTPCIPDYPGRELFKGKQLHSHDYRCPDPFQGESVLVVGAGPSGMDLAYEISGKAKRVTISHHLSQKLKTVFPSNVVQRPDVARLTENGAEFTDGSHETFSFIFYCTGYKSTFPFLSTDCGIFVEDNFVHPLFKHCININHPTMALIGLPSYICATQIFDMQVRFSMEYFSGRKHFPPKEEMLDDTQKEMEERWKKGFKKRQAHFMGLNQIKYTTDLSETAGIENLKPAVTKLHREVYKRFLDDLVNFRKDVFRIIDDETYIQIK